jgi:hypothetical protein
MIYLTWMDATQFTVGTGIKCHVFKQGNCLLLRVDKTSGFLGLSRKDIVPTLRYIRHYLGNFIL